MTLEDHLEQLANRAPPGDASEVLAAARTRAENRQHRRNGPLLAAAAAAVIAVAVIGATLGLRGNGEDTVTAAGPDGTSVDGTSTSRGSVGTSTSGGGSTAVWSVSDNDPPSETAQSFIAMVTRLACSGGETGEVLEPTVVIEADRIVVTFTVEPLPDGAYTCQGNNQVAYVVELGEPIGPRELIDGACLSGDAAPTSFCSDGATRWSS